MDNPKLNYYFGPTGGGDETGFNDPLTKGFKGSYDLAREAIQNAIDAKDSSVSTPVITEFTLIRITAKDLPSAERLKEIYCGCMEYESDNPLYCDSYQRMIRDIENDSTVQILKISDYGTVGLTEPNYERLLKRVGSSGKESGEGGSFGLGKGAYFASSAFRTVFFSSVRGNKTCIFQGKIRVSSRDENSVRLQGNGTYGLQDQQPVRDQVLIPELFRRKETGTDVFVIGFVEAESWEKLITRSVLNNFWLAILKNELIVRINKTEINQNNVGDFINANFNLEDRDKEDDGNPLPYFQAYTEPESNSKKIISEDLQTLGKVELHLKIDNNYPGKVAYFRKTHMLIFKKSKTSYIPFAAVFICDNDEGNGLLQAMENQRHNEWSKSNGTEKDEYTRKKMAAAEKELSEFIKNSIDSINNSDDKDTLEINGLDRYLFIPDIDDEFEGDGISGSILTGKYSNEETVNEIGIDSDAKATLAPVIKPIVNVADQPTQGEFLESEIGSTTIITGTGTEFPPPGPPNPGPDEPNDAGTKTGEIVLGDEKFEIAIPVKYRLITQKINLGYNQIIKIRGPANRLINVDIRAGTDEGSDPVQIVEAIDFQKNVLQFEGSRVKGISLDNNGTATIVLSLESYDKYSINIKAYANK